MLLRAVCRRATEQLRSDLEADAELVVQAAVSLETQISGAHACCACVQATL